jgi:hypothetical protein
MNDIIIVKIYKSAKQLLHNFTYELLPIVVFLIYVGKNGPSFAKLCHNIVEVVIVVKFVHFYDVGMVEF